MFTAENYVLRGQPGPIQGQPPPRGLAWSGHSRHEIRVSRCSTSGTPWLPVPMPGNERGRQLKLPLEHDPAFERRSCSIKSLKRADDSTQSHRASGARRKRSFFRAVMSASGKKVRAFSQSATQKARMQVSLLSIGSIYRVGIQILHHP